MPEVLESASLTIVVFGAFCGALVSGFAGFGFAAAAGGILLHTMSPDRAIPLLMICSVLVQVAGLIHLRKGVELQESARFVLGGFLGVPVAVAIFQWMDAERLRTAFGIFLVAYAAYALARMAAARGVLVVASASAPGRTVEPTGRAVPILVGFGGGLVGGFTAMPGALLSVWCDTSGLSKERQRGIVQPFILAMQLTALTAFFATTEVFDTTLLGQVAISAPFLAIGTALGLYLYGRIGGPGFRAAVLSLILASGFILLVR
ncbi:MAG TPA: TSUP family transporter [Afifellaceae bacterium]|nr:TSUP family transporter [Afifellaceae bacterium]